MIYHKQKRTKTQGFCDQATTKGTLGFFISLSLQLNCNTEKDCRQA